MTVTSEECFLMSPKYYFLNISELLAELKWTVAQQREKCWHFSMSKLVALEEKLMQFTQYQHTGAQTWHTGFEIYQEQYECKNL